MQVFDPSEIMEFAVTLEENGKTFYEHAVSITEDSRTKEMFKSLAQDEVDHKKTFKKMLSKITDYEPIQNYPEEYFAYLESYVDNVIFSEEAFKNEIKDINDPMAALDFALQAEQDSIVYYQELKKFVSEKHHNVIEEIIDEERKHYTKIYNMKEELE